MLGLQLGDMKDRVDSYSAGEAKRKRRSRGLRDDGERADLLLGKFACGAIGPNVVGAYEDTVSDTKQRRRLAMAVGVAGHSVLGILHMVTKELVDFVEVDRIVSSSKVGDFCIRVNGYQRVITTSGKKWGDAGRLVGRVVVCEFCEG